MKLIKRLLNKSSLLAIIIACLALGWVGNDIFSKYKLSYFNLERDVNIIDILTLFATIFLAYYIPSVLGNKEQSTRIEKDFIISKIHECSNMIESLVQTARINSAKYQETAAALQNIGISVSRINRYSLTSGIETDTKTTEIKKQLRQIRNLMTDTLTTTQIDSYNANGHEIPIIVNNNSITFSKSRIREIMQEDIILEKYIFDLIILVNRSS